MAIKIPTNIDIPIPSVGDQRSLLDITRQDRIGYERLTADITNVASKINSHNTAIERERIRNKATSESAKMNIDIQTIIQDIEKGDKHGNPYNEDQIEEIIKFKKKELDRKYGVDNKSLAGVYYNDTQASKDYFESEYWTNLHNFRASSHGIVKDRILADTKIRFEQIKTKHQNKKVIARNGMWEENGSWQLERKEITDAWEALQAAGDITTDLATVQKVVDDKHWRAAVVEEGEYRTDAMGNNVIDNLAVVKKLTAKNDNGTYKNKKFFGKTIDEKTRLDQIEYYRIQARDQSLTENSYIKRTNDDLMNIHAPKVLNNDPDGKGGDIEAIPFVGPDAVPNREILMKLRERVLLNQVPKEESIQAFRYINNGLIDGSINSLYQPFLVGDEVPDDANPEGWSIIERLRIDENATYGAVSDDNGLRFKNFLDQKYSNPEFIYHNRQFNEFLTRFNFEAVILGSQAATAIVPNILAQNRWQSTFILLQDTFNAEIKKGTSVQDLLDPDDDKYIWNLIGGLKSHIPSTELQIRETMESHASIEGKTVTEREDFRPPELNPRKYFTWEDWINSKEWQDWLNDKGKQKKYKDWKLKQ
jgi:hypothetical protein